MVVASSSTNERINFCSSLFEQRLLTGQQYVWRRDVRVQLQGVVGSFYPHQRVSFSPCRLHYLVLGLGGVSFTRKKRLMVLSTQVHVVKCERLFIGRPIEPLILWPSKKIERIPPHLAFGHCSVGLIALRFTATDPGTDVIKWDLLYKRCTILSKVPPFKNQYNSWKSM